MPACAGLDGPRKRRVSPSVRLRRAPSSGRAPAEPLRDRRSTRCSFDGVDDDVTHGGAAAHAQRHLDAASPKSQTLRYSSACERPLRSRRDDVTGFDARGSGRAIRLTRVTTSKPCSVPMPGHGPPGALAFARGNHVGEDRL